MISEKVAALFGVVAVASGVILRLLDLMIVGAIVMPLGVVPDSIDIVSAAWRDVVQEMPGLAVFGMTLIRLAPVVVNTSVTRVVTGRRGVTLVSFNEHAHLQELPDLLTYR